MDDKNIKVLLVDDHAVVRDGIRLMLGTVDDIEVTGEAETVQDALRLVREQDFDVALVDISLPGQSGLELIKRLSNDKPKLAVLILSMYAEDVYAERAMGHGAAGYLTKNSPAATIVAAIRTAAAGGKYVSPALAEKLAGLLCGGNTAPHEKLTNRELEVLRLLAAGKSRAHIAETLHLSPHTVTTYRTRILEKTGMKNNVQLARYAMENGLLM